MKQTQGEVFWNNVAARFVALESQLIFPFIQLDRVVISSYVPDSQPYNPTSFISLPFSINGTRQIVGDVAPANLCLVVRKNVTYGRDGRIFIRGNLLENDIIGGFPKRLYQPRKGIFYKMFSVTGIRVLSTIQFLGYVWLLVHHNLQTLGLLQVWSLKDGLRRKRSTIGTSSAIRVYLHQMVIDYG